MSASYLDFSGTARTIPPCWRGCQPAPAPRPWRQASRPGQEGRPRRHPGPPPARDPHPACGPTTHTRSPKPPWRCGGREQLQAAPRRLPQRCSAGSRQPPPRPRPERAGASWTGAACATGAAGKWAGRADRPSNGDVLLRNRNGNRVRRLRSTGGGGTFARDGHGLRTGRISPRRCRLGRPEGARQEVGLPCTKRRRPAPSRVAHGPCSCDHGP